MTIFRVKHDKENPYTIINRNITLDNRLSLKAKGLWLYAMSKPDDWKFNLSDIVNNTADGEKSVRSALKELEKFGYLVREQKKDDRGKFKPCEWIFYETPHEIQKSSPLSQNRQAVNGKAQKDSLLISDIHIIDSNPYGGIGSKAPPTPQNSDRKKIERAKHVKTTEREHAKLVTEYGEETTKEFYMTRS
jgi:hypothetical protein